MVRNTFAEITTPIIRIRASANNNQNQDFETSKLVGFSDLRSNSFLFEKNFIFIKSVENYKLNVARPTLTP